MHWSFSGENRRAQKTDIRLRWSLESEDDHSGERKTMIDSPFKIKTALAALAEGAFFTFEKVVLAAQPKKSVKLKNTVLVLKYIKQNQ